MKEEEKLREKSFIVKMAAKIDIDCVDGRL